MPSFVLLVISPDKSVEVYEYRLEAGEVKIKKAPLRISKQK